MNVNQPNQSALGASAATARARTAPAHSPAVSSAVASDRDLAELVRSLCALAADSPERQAKIQGLMHAYATGDLQVDAEATAEAIVDDAIGIRWALR